MAELTEVVAAQPLPATDAPRSAFWSRRWWTGLWFSTWLAPAALLTCFAGAAGLVMATDPTDNVGPTTCAFKLATGFDCPGCGGTRALYYTLHLNLPEAARHHAIALFAAPFLTLLYIGWALRRVFPSVNWKLPRLRVTPTMATYFLIAWAAFWVLRNLPFAPFTALYM